MTSDPSFLLGSLAAKLDAADARFAAFEHRVETRFDEIDARLADGSRRFHEDDERRAADGVVRGLALKVGTWALAAVASLGGTVIVAALAHFPAVAAWFVPPKH